jgi:hypothetical protein
MDTPWRVTDLVTGETFDVVGAAAAMTLAMEIGQRIMAENHPSEIPTMVVQIESLD